MRHRQLNPDRKREKGLIMTLVAIFMLGVVGAMAALAIDVVTFYTGRSEAQLVADGAALAGARVLANSGMTSDSNLASSAKTICQTVSQKVALSNQIEGQTPTIATDTCNVSSQSNPTVTVKVQANLPTFFARIWGTTQVTVVATASAEAYNPSSAGGVSGNAPVAPTCVKPLLLANSPDPSGSAAEIFDPASGAIQPTKLLGSQQTLLSTGGANKWVFSAGDTFANAPPSFPPPSASSVTCNGSRGFNNFQLAVAGCVQTPISCNNNTTITITSATNYTGEYPGPGIDGDTQQAVNCMSNSNTNQGDTMPVPNVPPTTPFEFVSGGDNPVVQAGGLSSGTDILVSDSLMTLPVYTPTTPVTLVGFVQVFANPNGTPAPATGIPVTVVNLIGCGSGATGTTIYGNGPSPVAVRLITPSS